MNNICFIKELKDYGIIQSFELKENVASLEIFDLEHVKYIRDYISCNGQHVVIKEKNLQRALAPLFAATLFDFIENDITLAFNMASQEKYSEGLLYILDFHAKHKDDILCCKGSSHNHQSWKGGYYDHIRACIELANNLTYLCPKGKLHKALKVLYFHDVDKLARYGVHTATKYLERGILETAYSFLFDEEEINALKYIHGEGADYNKNGRTMGELAAFCHIVDVASARIFHSHWELPNGVV